MTMAAEASRRQFARRLDRAVQRRRATTGTAPPSAATGTVPAPALEEVQKASPAAKILIVLFMLTLCLPFSGRVGALRLAPSTFYLLLAFLPFCWVWLIRRRKSLCLPDLCMWLFWLWASAALVIGGGLAPNIEPIGLHLLQSVGGYAAGRVLVSNAASMRFMIRTALGALVLATPFVLVEFLGSRPLILEMASKIAPTLPTVNMSPRLGFHRVQAFLEHPILYGIFSASLFSLVVVGLRRGRPMARWSWGFVPILNAIVSLSTGALLSLNMQFGLLLWNRVFVRHRRRWYVLAAACVVGYVVLDILTVRTPFHTFVRYATFNSGSSYNRILIWEYGTAVVAANPWFGIGIGEWDRPSFMSSSMDNFWLVQAVRYGIPALVLIAAIPISIILRSRNHDDAPEATRQLMLAGNVALVSTVVAIVSVHIWNATYIWLTFLMGACVWYTQRSRNPAEPAPQDVPPPAIVPSGRSAAQRAVRSASRG